MALAQQMCWFVFSKTTGCLQLDIHENKACKAQKKGISMACNNLWSSQPAFNILVLITSIYFIHLVP